MSEASGSPKERAKALLQEGEPPKAVAEATGLSLNQVHGLMGVLARGRSGGAQGGAQPPGEGGSDSLPELVNDEDHLAYILGTAKIPKKDVTGILELVDDYGFDAEGINSAMEDQNIRRAVRKKVLTRWSARTGEELPQWLEEELSTTRRGSRERGRGQYVTFEQLEKLNRDREEKSRLQRLEEKVDKLLSPDGGLTPRAQPGVRYREVRTPIDRNGVPCDPNNAHSVRYERIPLSEGGDGQVSQLRKEIADLKEKMFSDQISGLSSQIQELRERGGSDVSAIAGALKDVLSSWSDSQGGPIVRAANPLVDAFGKKVLANYNAMSPMPEDMRTPTEPTPPRLIERLRQEGLVSTFIKREEGRK